MSDLNAKEGYLPLEEVGMSVVDEINPASILNDDETELLNELESAIAIDINFDAEEEKSEKISLLQQPSKLSATLADVNLKAMVEINKFDSNDVGLSVPLNNGKILVANGLLMTHFDELQKLKSALHDYYDSNENLSFTHCERVELEQFNVAVKQEYQLTTKDAIRATEYKANQEFEMLVQHGYDNNCTDMQFVLTDQLSVDYRLDKVIVPSLHRKKDAALGLRIITAAVNNNDGGGDLNFDAPQSFRFNVKVRDKSGQEKNIQTRAEKTPIYSPKAETALLLSVRLVETSVPKPLHEYDVDKPVQHALKRAFNKSKGLILVTGPTGSGKTTLLGGAMHYFPKNLSGRTVEDPVELNLQAINPNITQVSADKEQWDIHLSSMLRQDPDLIMLGEVRTLHQAVKLIEAASTGHIAVSTLHTNDAIGIIGRFIKMGVPKEDFLEYGLLQLLVATRLVPKTCQKCSLKFHELSVDKQERIKRGFGDADFDNMRFGNPNFVTCENIKDNKLTDCDCNQGYKGVHGVTEFIEPSRAMIQKIASDGVNDLDIWLKERGWRSMQDIAKIKSLEGTIDPFACSKDFPELLSTIESDPHFHDLYTSDE